MLSVLHGFYKSILLTLLVILGLSCGHLADATLQKSLPPYFAAKTVTDEYAAIKPRKTPKADFNLIFENNIFDASNRSLSAVMGIPFAATAVANAETFGTGCGNELAGCLISLN